MFGLHQETPSRILRRIQAAELEDDDMPTLPSLSGSADADSSAEASVQLDKSRRAPAPAPRRRRSILSPLNANHTSQRMGHGSPSTAHSGGVTRSPEKSSVINNNKGKHAAGRREGGATTSSDNRQASTKNGSQPSSFTKTASSSFSARTVRRVASRPVHLLDQDQDQKQEQDIPEAASVSYVQQPSSFDQRANLSAAAGSGSLSTNLSALEDSVAGLEAAVSQDQEGQEVSLQSSSNSADDDNDDDQGGPTPVPASKARFASSRDEHVRAVNPQRSISPIEEEAEEDEAEVEAVQEENSSLEATHDTAVVGEEEQENSSSGLLPELTSSIDAGDSIARSPISAAPSHPHPHVALRRRGGNNPSLAGIVGTGRPSLHSHTSDDSPDSLNAAVSSSQTPQVDSPSASTTGSRDGSGSERRAKAVRIAANPVLRPSVGTTQAGDEESEIGSTPGIGRRLPSAASSTGLDGQSRRATSASPYGGGSTAYELDTTPLKVGYDRSSSAPPPPPSTTTTLPGQGSQRYGEEFATPRAATAGGGQADADLERRKNHLLSTLRLTAQRPLIGHHHRKTLAAAKKGTPHPTRTAAAAPASRTRRARSVTPAAGEDASASQSGLVFPTLSVTLDNEEGGEDLTASSSASASTNADQTCLSTSSSGSSTDLTTHPRRGLGNTSLPLAGQSLPGGGGGGGSGLAGGRFNGAKLNAYLHTLNSHLSQENQNLVKTLEETAREVQRLQGRNRELLEASTTGGAVEGEEGSRARETEAGNVSREKLEGHRRTRDDIQHLRKHLTGSAGGEPTTSSEGQEQQHFYRDEEMATMKNEMDDLRARLEERDTEISSLREQLLLARKNSSDKITDGSSSSLQAQIFALTDELSSTRASLSSSEALISQLRSEALSTVSRHTSAISDLQERTDELLVSLEERDGQLDEVRIELETQEYGFKERMKKLEEELCAVMEEKDGELEDAREEIRRLKEDGEDKLRKYREEHRQAKKECDALREEKAHLQSMLDRSTERIAGDDARSTQILNERIALLQQEVRKLEEALEAKQEALSASESANSDVQRKLRAAQSNLEAAELRAGTAERKLSSQTSAQSELADVRASLRDSEARISVLERELEETRAALVRAERDLVNTSFEALQSDLQKKLDLAHREIGNLKHQLASPAYHATAGTDSRDLEIRNLKSSNHELETRVSQLKRQALLGGGAAGNSARNGMTMNTPQRAAAGSAGTPEKSVRFDSVQSMKTPRSATQMLGSMSFLDKSDANATIAPLYEEIDDLHAQVKQYQALLASANDEVDDKLRKLNRAGNGAVDLSREVEKGRERIRMLEDQLAKGVGKDGETIIRELKSVKEQLINERMELLRKLEDINAHCQHISSQLEASRSSEAQLAKEALQLRLRLAASSAASHPNSTDNPALSAERALILQNIASLHKDLSKVQSEAVDLGEDIKLARHRLASDPHAAVATAGAEEQQQQKRAKEEAKGLLIMIKYLKAKFTRESYWRADLAHQKLYLTMLLAQKQKMIDATEATLARFGMPPSASKEANRRPSLRGAVNAVIAIERMKRLAEEWRKENAIKESLREAYKQTRGKAFVPAVCEGH